MTDTTPRESRAAILDAARGVQDTVGYRGFTIDAVTARAQVDRAAIDRWWTDESDLLIDVLAEAMAIKKIPKLGNSRSELGIVLRHMISLYTDWHRFEPALLAFAGHPVTITTIVGRDFMPLTGGGGLDVRVTVGTVGPGVLPPFLRADRVAVRHDDEVWVAPLTEQDSQSRTSRSFQVVAGPGPEWETGSSVDVVVLLRTEWAQPWPVQAPNLRIARTE